MTRSCGAGSAAADGEVPVLTDVVAEESCRGARWTTQRWRRSHALSSARCSNGSGPKWTVSSRSARALNTALGEAVVEVHAEIALSVQQTVREAVAASVAFLRPKTR